MVKEIFKQELDTTAILTSFRNHLQAVADLSDPLWLMMTEAMQITVIKKGGVLLGTGSVCRHIYYIYKGCFRFIYFKADEEITTDLFTAGVCMTNMTSLNSGQPSDVSIEAIEEAITIKISKESLIGLYKKAPELEEIYRLVLQQMSSEEAVWKKIYTVYNPEERYLFLMERAPVVLQQVPLQYIASFLGIRRETLSRIRKRTLKSF